MPELKLDVVRMKVKLKRPYLKLFYTVLSLGLIGCGSGSGFEAVGPNSHLANNRTGAETVVTSPSMPEKKFQVPYTISGHKSELSRIESKLGAQLNTLFSQSIYKVTANILDEDGKSTTSSPKKVKLDVEVNEPYKNSLTASAELEANNGKLRANGKLKANTNDGNSYEFELACLDAKCSNLEIIITKFKTPTSQDDNTEDTREAAGVLITESHPILQLRRQKGLSAEYADKKLEKLFEVAKDPNAVTRKTVVVLNGRSYADVTVKDKKAGQEKDKEETLLSFQTSLTETNTTAAQVDSLFIENKDALKIENQVTTSSNRQRRQKGFKAALVGNNPDTGSFAVDLIAETKLDTLEAVESNETATTRNRLNDEPTLKVVGTQVNQESVRLFLIEPDFIDEDNHEYKEENATPIVSSENGVFPIPANLEAYAQTSDVIKRIHLMHSPNRGRVKKIINQLQSGRESDTDECGNTIKYNQKARLNSFLTHAQYISEPISEMSKKLDVTPKIANLAFIESNFFYENSASQYLKLQNIVSHVGAAGPFQIMYKTGVYLNKDFIPGRTYTITPSTLNSNPDKRKTKPEDDRNFLIPSVHMAAKYMKKLFKEAKDPALAAFAYNRGEGNRNNDQNKTLRHLGVSEEDDRLSRHDVTLDEVLSYNMRVKNDNVCHAAYYAYTFIALHFISENPEMYGFNLGTISKDNQQKLNKALIGPKTKLSPEIKGVF